ncbi:hypothetical protein JCM11957_11880 [Caminibacter profundus]
MLSKANKLIKSNIFRYVIGDFLSIGISFLISTFILVKLGSVDLGKFVFYFLLAGLFSSFAQGAANSFLMKYFYIEDFKEIISSVNVTMVFFSFISVAVFLVFYHYINTVLLDTLIFFAILKAFNSTPFVVFRLKELSFCYMFFSVFYRVGWGVILPFLFLLNKFDVYNLILLIFVWEILSFVVLYFYLYKLGFKLKINKKLIKKNVLLSLKLFPHKVLKTVSENIDKYAVKFFLGDAALGIYSILYKITSIVYMFTKSLNNEIAVILSKISSNKTTEAEFEKKENKLILSILLVNILAFLIAFFYNKWVYYLGSNFYLLYFILISFMNLQFFYFIFYNYLFLQSKRIIYNIMLLNNNIFLCFLFFIKKTLTDIAYVYSLSYFLSVGLLTFFVKSEFLKKIKLYYWVLFFIFLIGGFYVFQFYS